MARDLSVKTCIQKLGRLAKIQGHQVNKLGTQSALSLFSVPGPTQNWMQEQV